MSEKLTQRLSDFGWENCLTKIRINDAIINTLTEIGELLDCGVISCEKYIHLGKEIGMNISSSVVAENSLRSS